MKRLTAAGLPVAALLVLLLGSCTTSSFMGLSRSKHVDTQLEEMQAEIEQLSALEKELAEALENEDRLQAAVDELRGLTDDFTLKLDTVADEIRTELESIPDETLRDLVNAIESYLNEGQGPETPAPAGESPTPAGDADSEVPEGTDEPDAAGESDSN